MRTSVIKLVEIPLGDEGIAYVESCLQQGTGLCSRVLETSFKNGKAFAPLPENTNLERAKKFSVGGLITRRDTKLWLADYIRGFRHAAEVGGLVFQDVWAKPSDVRVRNFVPRPFFHGENVYYYLDGEAANIYSVTEVFRAIKSYLLIAMYSDYSPSSSEL